ncbi:hypothetical protein E1295_00010 [Nonomuraea mesophila]|uniref:Uncharacterized protein n=1 Tax=Nonomuraea mesophila TaxID=2530382 RepID=A0A4R5FXL1_9ACTN|nr:hypothetical protein [Nonomuraea mesophila]TDE60273.1 hypothetical protein E1295_00010 [Nonomuraea mesophila]
MSSSGRLVARVEVGRQLGWRCVSLEEDEHGSWYFAVQVRGPAGRRERSRRGGFAAAEQAHHAGGDALVADQDSGPGTGQTVARWLRCWSQTQQGPRPAPAKATPIMYACI